MKYRHEYHAGNFADVHKHVTLLALLAALRRKDKGFFYLETHAGRGAYDLSGPPGESASGIGRLEARYRAPATEPPAEEIRHYLERVGLLRRERGEPRLYPGSPLLAASELRSVDRAVLIEQLPAEARALERALSAQAQGSARPDPAHIRVETGDGFERLRAWLPPRERRGLTFIDPPYEESRQDFERTRHAAAEALRRFHTGVVAVWYPIKDRRDTEAWHAALAAELDCGLLAAELALYPPDSRVALNGSGMLILNPPYQLAERITVWLPQLHASLDQGHGGGVSVRQLKL
ncbi:MAG TPA: 23S rRNA (adenine(2030)-N(6))-methyltransferase RlmJ [Steroidobacteraceae bacterium]